MTDIAILETMKTMMAEMLLENNKRIDISIEKAVRSSEKRLEKKIENAQIETIDTLSELIHTGYNLHEKRIQRIEDELHLPPIKQKH